MYSFDSSAQPRLCLLSLGVGFALGLVYDLFRAVRLTVFGRSAAAAVVFDILYFAVFGFVSFIFILALNRGEVRLYIILAELAGAVGYYFSFGAAAIKLTDAFVRFMRRARGCVYKVVSLPFRAVGRAFSALKRQISKKNAKFLAKKKNFFKKLLKKHRIWVYNLFGVICRPNKNEGNVNFEQKQNNQKGK